MSAITKRLLPRKPGSDVARGSRQRERYMYALIFLAPGMLMFFAFLLMPLSNSFYYSGFDWNGYGPPTDFVGLDNYSRLMDHSVFHTAIQNSLYIVVLSVLVQLPLALSLALLVGRGKLPGRSIFRTILFIPYVFSEILTAYIWIYALQPNGLVNLFLGSVVPEYQNILWLADRNVVVISVFIVITWKYFGLHMILYMAALQGVNSEVEDSARIDGATELEIIRYVTIPLIGPMIRLTVYLSVLGSFQQFVLVWILMNGGGPANASQVIATYLYKFGILSSRLGYGSAVAVVLFVITLSFSLIYQFFVMRQDYTTS